MVVINPPHNWRVVSVPNLDGIRNPHSIVLCCRLLSTGSIIDQLTTVVYRLSGEGKEVGEGGGLNVGVLNTSGVGAVAGIFV